MGDESTPKVTALPYHVPMITQPFSPVKGKLPCLARKVADRSNGLLRLPLDVAVTSRLRPMLDCNAMARGTTRSMLGDDSILNRNQPLATPTLDLCTHVSAPCLVVTNETNETNETDI